MHNTGPSWGKKHRWIAALAAGGLAVVSLTACGGSSGSSDADTSHPSGELNIMVSSADASDAAFRAIDTAFQKKYPDVKVKLTTVSNDNYPAALSSRLTAKNVDIMVLRSLSAPPDYAADSASDDVRLARAGGVVDLTDQPFMKRFSKSVLDSQALDGKQYAVPTGLSYTTGTYYNKTIFKKNGITPPKTWDELVTACKKLKSAGVTPFGIGGKESWPAGLFELAGAEGQYPTDAEKTKLAADLWAGKVKLTDKKPTEVLSRVEQVYQFAQPNFAGASYEDIPAGFAAGKYAMIADGTWNQPVIDKAVAGKFEYGYIPTPMGDTEASNDHLTGKIELQLGVASSTKNKSAALAWMDFFSQPKNYATFTTKSGFSPAEDSVKKSAFLTSIAPYTKTFEPSWSKYWFPNDKAGQDAVYPFNYPALQPLGSSTPEQAADAAQKAWSAAS